MKSGKLRIVVPLAVLALAGVGFVAHTGTGTLSAIGWQDVSVLCPLGALSTMLASKTVVPRAVVSLVVAVAAIAVLGRAFCGWICPVPVVDKLRGLFKKQDGRAGDAAEVAETGAATPDAAKTGSAKAEATSAAATAESSGSKTGAIAAAAEADAGTASGAGAAAPGAAGADTGAPLTADERAALAASCHGACSHDANGSRGASSVCGSCGQAPSNSRHIVLGASLLSAAVFGFPMFCLICPIGLTFALVFVLVMLFGNGDVTWSVVAIPAVLLVEVVFFRSWCSHICPLSALMSLVGKANRTFRPAIDDAKCLETAHDATCGRCAQVCEVAIDPRHPQLGADMSECTRCRACADACPGNAITLPLLASGKESNRARLKQ